MEISKYSIDTKSFLELEHVASARSHITDVRRIDKQDVKSEDFSDGPVIVSGYPVTDSLWDDLKKKHGSYNLTVRYGEYRDPESYYYKRKFKETALQDLFTSIENGSTDYAGNQPIEDKEILSSLNISKPPFFPGAEFTEPRMWLGGKGCITPLHKDSAPNFSFQLYGTKKWVVFDIKDIRKLHMSRPLENTDFAASNLDLREFDLNNCVHGATPIQFTINPGELLYLPSNWGHYVETLSENIMINFWMPESTEIKKNSKLPWEVSGYGLENE